MLGLSLHPADGGPGKTLSVNEGAIAAKSAVARKSKSAQFGRIFNGTYNWDVAAASDGHYIVTAGNGGGIYLTDGTLVQPFVPYSQIFCPSVNPLPVCNGGFNGDQRIYYDPTYGTGRWIITALWQSRNPTSFPQAQAVLAVSATNDPGGTWYKWNFPACGPNDTGDNSDQPHSGFNSLWIAIDSACSSGFIGSGGGGLVAINKVNAYNNLLTYTRFEDPVSESSNADNPTSDYSANESREILTATRFYSDGTVRLLTSYLGGTADAPSFYSAGWQSGTPAYRAVGLPPVNSPGGLISALTANYVSSSGVYTSTSGDPYLVAKMVVGDPQFTNASQIMSFVVDTLSGGWNSLQILGGANGSGPMASEIAMPLVLPGSNTAMIAYTISRTEYYPSLKIAYWTIDTMQLNYIALVQQGVNMPDTTGCPDCPRDRWADFYAAISPLPLSSNFFVGGTASVTFSNYPSASVWTTVTP